MKNILTLALVFIAFNCYSQISFYVDEDISYPDIRIRIGDDVSYPDVRVRIGESVSYEDFTVGITDKKSQANFIITDSKYRADKTIRASDDVSYPDIRIRSGEDVSYPDVRIEIKKSGTVDYIVFTEKSFITMNDLVVALLPAINKEMDYELEDIPVYVDQSSSYNSTYSDQNTGSTYSDAIILLRGASVIAQDGKNTFLGTITNEFNSNSIFNDIGTYGSDISSNSIWNDIGTYGSDISSYSPFNDITSSPTMIVKDGQIIGYLTVNDIISGGVSPYILKGLKDQF